MVAYGQAIYVKSNMITYLCYLQHHQWNRLSGIMNVIAVNVLYNQTISYFDNTIIIADSVTERIITK